MTEGPGTNRIFVRIKHWPWHQRDLSILAAQRPADDMRDVRGPMAARTGMDILAAPIAARIDQSDLNRQFQKRGRRALRASTKRSHRL
jgi:hypothetical protein